MPNRTVRCANGWAATGKWVQGRPGIGSSTTIRSGRAHPSARGVRMPSIRATEAATRVVLRGDIERIAVAVGLGVARHLSALDRESGPLPIAPGRIRRASIPASPRRRSGALVAADRAVCRRFAAGDRWGPSTRRSSCAGRGRSLACRAPALPGRIVEMPKRCRRTSWPTSRRSCRRQLHVVDDPQTLADAVLRPSQRARLDGASRCQMRPSLLGDGVGIEREHPA